MIKETYFITHGSPRLTVDDTHPLHIFFKSWNEKVFTKKPKAILVISAHWLSDQPSVNAVDVNETMYDYEGITYPAPLYQLKYPAPGSPDLAKRIQELLIDAGFETVHIDKERGLDHATWVPLMVMYPEANIPVCELSVQQHLDAKHHFNLGRALAPLKDEDVLIIGTGSTTHPSWDTPHYRDGVAPWAAEFVSWLEGAIVDGRYEELNEFETKAPNLKQAHPMPEHLFPLQVVIGAAGENCKAEIIHSSWYYGLLSNGTLRHGAYKFTSC